MKQIISLVILVTALIVANAQQLSSEGKLRYPNELPNLKLYQEARWNSILPNVSTRDDVERILGKPLPIYDERFYVEKFNDYLVGYDYDADWIIFVHYWGEGGDVPASAVGRVADITLHPRKRVSLRGVKFPSAFSASGYIDRRSKSEGKTYYDSSGLTYSIYAKDTSDGRHLEGDLKVIVYGPPDKADEKDN
jgi:hypothetical protein